MKCPADISKYLVTIEKLKLMLSEDKRKAFEGSSKAEKAQEVLHCFFIIARELGLLDTTVSSILESIPEEGARKALGLGIDMVQAYANGTEFDLSLDFDYIKKSLDTLMTSVQLQGIDQVLDDFGRQLDNLRKAYNNFKKATATQITMQDSKSLDPVALDIAVTTALNRLDNAVQEVNRLSKGKPTGPAITSLETAEKALKEALMQTEDSTIKELEKLNISRAWMELDRSINSLGVYLQRSWWEKEIEKSPAIKKLTKNGLVAFDTLLSMVGIKPSTPETEAFLQWIREKTQEWWLTFAQSAASGDFLDTLASEVQSSNKVYYQIEDILSKLLDSRNGLRGSAVLYKNSRLFLYQLQDSLSNARQAVSYAKAQLRHNLGDYVVSEKDTVQVSSALVVGIAKTAFNTVGPDLAIFSGTLSLAIRELQNNFLKPAMKDMQQFFTILNAIKVKGLTAEQLLLTEDEQAELRTSIKAVKEAMKAVDLFGLLTDSFQEGSSQIKAVRWALKDAAGIGMTILEKITPTLGPVLMKALYEYAKSKMPGDQFNELLGYLTCITQILGVTLNSDQDIQTFRLTLFK
ncbi:MAG: hypothetical protein KO464_02205 [Candidatus Methanofastidiosum sp.]|nr:hypothetical protein [Methanofastidiosum sp.]